MPQIRLRDAGGVLRTVARIRLRDAAGVLQTIQRIRMRDAAGVLRTVWQFLSVTLSPTTQVTGNYDGGGTADITTATVIASPVGGTAPFTYLWTQVGVSAYTWLINSPAASSTSFTGQGIEEGVNTEVEFDVLVTDSVGATASAQIWGRVRNRTVFDHDPHPFD